MPGQSSRPELAAGERAALLTVQTGASDLGGARGEFLRGRWPYFLSAVRIRWCKKLLGVQIQSPSKSANQGDRHVALRTLDGADVGAVHLGSICECLLCKTDAPAQDAQVFGDK